MIIISSGKFKPELLLEKLDEYLSKYTLNNHEKNEINELTIKIDTQTVEHTFINVKESNKIDASLFYKIKDLSYNDKSLTSIVLKYFQKYKLEKIENELKKDDKDIYLSTQTILDEKGYNFFNLRIFNIDKQTVQTTLLKVKKSLLETDFNIEELKELILNKQIELDERYDNNSFVLKELISYLVSSNFDLDNYNENLETEIFNLLSYNNCKPFKELFNRIINENNLHTYLFKNKTSNILEDIDFNYDENIDKKISKYIEDKNNILENILSKYLDQIKNIQIPGSLLLSTNDYISKRKFKETKFILSNDDSNLTFEKDLLVYLLSLGIKALIDDIDYIYKSIVEARNGQIQIIVFSDNNDTDITNKLLNVIKDTDFNNYKLNIINYANSKIELIKNSFNKQNFIFSTVSNLARHNSFNENSLCFLELENKLSFINEINLNEVKSYLFNKEDMTSYNLVKKNYSNVLFITNRSNITCTALNIKGLSLSIEENKTIELKLKEILEVEIKQKRGLYGHYVQCSHDIFMIGIICDNNYNESLSLITTIMNSFSSSNDKLLKKISEVYLNNINNLKTCVLLNRKDTICKKENFDLIYEFDD
ncbi:MAG: hypothetical protein MJ246_01025 [Clostridia bacterium]|nr:hypothetical protein [Clostridia bacterium]